jgi:predicted permease
MTARPPTRPRRVLERCLSRHDRDELIGDLNEEFQERQVAWGHRRAVVWYWAQAIGLVLAKGRLTQALRVPDDAPRRGPWADAAADWRLAWRSLRHARGFTLVALLSMTMSLGLATAVFSIVRTVLLQPVAVPTADRLVRLGTFTPGIDTGRHARITAVGGTPPPLMLRDIHVGAWLERRRALGPLATYEVTPATVVLGAETMRVGVAMVGPEFFDVFPVRPVAGRTLARQDAGRGTTAVTLLSERLIRQRLADPSVLIGRMLTIDERRHEIAGVLPLDFDWPLVGADVWVADRTVWPAADMKRNFSRSTFALGLIRPGNTRDDVQREGQRIADDVHAVNPDPRATGSPRVAVTFLADDLLAPVWPALMVLTLGTIGVVIAANVNLAAFLKARRAARHRDLAVRRALGASDWRVVRPVLFELILLGAASAVGAMLLGHWAIRALPLIAPPDLPRLASVTIDRTSLLFAWSSAALTALIVGLLPARSLRRVSLREVAGEGISAVVGTGRSAEWSRGVLVTTQIALAMLLLVGSILVGRSLHAMLTIDPGYQPEGVLTFQVAVTGARAQPGRIWDFYTTLQSRLLSHRDVVSVGLSDALPLHGETLRSTFVVPGVTPPRDIGAPAPTAHIEAVSAQYLQTLRARLTQGRFFSEPDVSSVEPTAIVNEAFVRAFLPDVDPVGQVLPRGVRRYSIIGVIATLKRAPSTLADDPAFYTLLTPQREPIMGRFSTIGVAVRTTGDPDALSPVVRDVVRELAPDAPVHNLMPLDARVDRTFAQPRFFAVALTVFAALALATALIGVYGALAASVERRRLELGVRRALGATETDVARLVLRRALGLAAIGLVAGSLLAALFAAVGQSTLYGIAPLDAASYVAAAAVILIAVFGGAWLPIQRALRIDPVRVLRAE